MRPVRRFLTRPCVLVTVTPGTPSTPTEPVYDDFGVEIAQNDMGETAPIETRVATTCELQQATTKEIRDGGVVEVSTWRLFLPPDTQVKASSRIEVDGKTFTLDGAPWTVRHPRTGALSHIECVVRLAQ